MSKRAQTSIVTTARRTEASDVNEIVEFVTKSTCELFGPVCREKGKIQEIIEKSVLSITLEDQSTGKILAQACFNDYPNLHGVAPSDWESWLNETYEADKNNSLNTLFLHFFVSHGEFSIACTSELIRSAFKAVPECHYILLCVPVNTAPEHALSHLFSEMTKKQSLSATAKSTVFVVNRDKCIPVLHVRNARVNDNDDLAPLFNSYTESLRVTYGEFYVAELIEAQDEMNKCLTAEAQGFGIGFMAITKDVNTSLLNECYELIPFHGLCKRHDDDRLRPPDEEEASPPDASQIKHKLSDAGIMKRNQSEEDFNSNVYKGGDSSDEEESIIAEYEEAKRNFIPVYAGEPNAFAIQLFCIEDKYDSRSLDFLEKAFDAFPDRDFCIITLPPNVPEFPLVQNFVRVTPRDTNKINNELYLFHRAGLIKSFQVRKPKESDFDKVKRLVGTLTSCDSILKDLEIFLRSRKDPNGMDVEAFVAEVMGRIVGIAILRPEEDIEYLRSNFNIEDFIIYNHHKRDEHGHLHHFALIPIFSFLTKYFIKDIMRKSSKTCLYYPIYPEYADAEINQRYSLITALNFMVPVRRRAQIEYNVMKLGVNLPSDQVLKPRFNYLIPSSLNHINRKLLLEPKVAVNLRIVVVGCSDVGVSFLENLVFRSHLRFNNITLVTADGMPGTLPPNMLRDTLRCDSMNYSHKDYAALSLRSWVNIINGKVTAIDRRKKLVTINESTVLPYDHLILCAGEQYYPIAPMRALVYNAYSKKEVKPHLARPLFDSPPPNMFVINTEQDAHNLLYFIDKNDLLNSEENVVFYGFDMNVLCAIQLLLGIGVDPNRIKVFCEKEPFKLFNNPYVQSKIVETFKQLNIKVYENYQMQEWNHNRWSSGEPLRTVEFQTIKSSEEESAVSVSLNCCLLLCYYKKDVDYTIFRAMNSCHLVYDGRLVIDNDYHTNDACIRAAGRLTKYKRAYYVDDWSHSCFNQKEIGVDLAYKMLGLVDPVLIVNQELHDERTDSHRVATNDPDEKVLIQLYKKPLVKSGILPGKYYYLHVTKPGLFVSYEEERVEREELVTNSYDNGYFRIHLNKHKCVQSITCFSKKKFNASNIIKLYGLHEQFLNKLLLKYSQNAIKDFYVFFSDNWCHALYHDRFEDLTKEIRAISINQNNGIKSANDILRELVDKDLILTKDQRDSIHSHFGQSGTRGLVERRLLSYLAYNSNHLPMYAKPDMV